MSYDLMMAAIETAREAQARAELHVDRMLAQQALAIEAANDANALTLLAARCSLALGIELDEQDRIAALTWDDAPTPTPTPDDELSIWETDEERMTP